MKLQARLAECEGTVENLNSKLIQLEKHKQKLQQDIEEVGAHVDQANIQHNMMEKKKTSGDCGLAFLSKERCGLFLGIHHAVTHAQAHACVRLSTPVFLFMY